VVERSGSCCLSFWCFVIPFATSASSAMNGFLFSQFRRLRAISAITRDFGDYMRYPGFPGKPDVGFLGWYKMSASPKEPHADNRLSPAKRDLLNLHHQ
jgi:hypothetical protein